MATWIFGRGTGQPGVAFVLDDDDCAGVGDDEIRPGNSDARVQKFGAQSDARFGGQLLGGRVRWRIEHLGDLFDGLVQGGRDDVIRSLLGKLNNVLAEVGFNHFDAARFQVMVEVNFLGDHRLRLHDQLDAALASQIRYELTGFAGVARPDEFAAAGGNVALQFFEVIIEMVERMFLDVVGVLTQFLIIGKVGDGVPPGSGEPRGGGINRALQPLIGERAFEFFVRGFHGRSLIAMPEPPPDARW